MLSFEPKPDKFKFFRAGFEHGSWRFQAFLVRVYTCGIEMVGAVKTRVKEQAD